MTRLSASSTALMRILRTSPDLRDGPALGQILGVLAERRAMDLTDLTPGEQASLVAARSAHLLPSVSQLTDLLASGRRLTVKFGIDPTAADVHVGHAVSMLIASRFQRMGHRVVFIVGDITARIGDPSGRTADRPPLTDVDVRHNIATYREQVSPFFDFEQAEFCFNSEWLAPVTLPAFLGVLEKLPLSASLQREDFRTRLAAGSGLTMAELVYSVVMALDSVHVAADVEIGGLDQLLNMHMGRRVMENAGQTPEVIVATGLIEGTDGTGVKMSKSKGNYIGLSYEAKDVFGRFMSAPDRLVPEYLRALTELLDPEVESLLRDVHPMGVKTLLAADVTAAIHGVDAAMAAVAGFRAQFSRRRYSDTPDVPVVSRSQPGTVAELLVSRASVPSLNQARRVARGGGLRLVVEASETETVMLSEADANSSLADVVPARHGRVFLKCGRALLEVRP